MIIELSEEYIPERFVDREEQYGKIKKIFSNFKKFGCGTNMAIFGVTGSGKTSLIKKIIQEENNSKYINCQNVRTTHKVIQELFNIKAKELADVSSLAVEELKRSPKVLIIDEIDKIKDLDSMMNILNFIYRKTMVPIIIMTLKRDLLENIPVDAKKTLFFSRINLPSYDSFALKEILIDRIGLIKKNRGESSIPEIDSGTISFISAMAAQQGSARVLLAITLKCFQEDNFSQDFIQEVYCELIKQDWMGFLQELNSIEKEFLLSLLETADGEKEISSLELQNINKISQPRTSQLINVLEKYGVAVSRHDNLGRQGGRKRMVRFSSNEVYEDLKRVLSEEVV